MINAFTIIASLLSFLLHTALIIPFVCAIGFRPSDVTALDFVESMDNLNTFSAYFWTQWTLWTLKHAVDTYANEWEVANS